MPTANAFIETYDSVQVHKAKRGMSSEEQNTRLQELNTKTRMWLAVLRRDVPEFSSADINWSAGVPDDAIASARRVLAMAGQQPSVGGGLQYAEALTADLTTAIEAAEDVWDGARLDQAGQGDQEGRLRDLTTAFQAEMVALRSALLAALGKNHPDYKLLRMPKTRATAEEADTANDNADAEPTTAPELVGNG